MYSFYQFINENTQSLTAEESLLRVLAAYKTQPEDADPLNGDANAAFAMIHPACNAFGKRFMEDGSADDLMLPVDIITDYLQQHEKNDAYRSSFQSELEYGSTNGEIAFTELGNIFPESYIEDVFSFILLDSSLCERAFGSGFMQHYNELKNWFEVSKKAGKFEVYRSITLSADPTELSKDTMVFDGIGRYWTHDQAAASSYWGSGSDTHSYTLVAEVNGNDVEWCDSVYKSIYKLNTEKEVFLKEDSVVKIVDVVYNDKRPRRASTNYVTYVTCGTQAD